MLINNHLFEEDTHKKQESGDSQNHSPLYILCGLHDKLSSFVSIDIEEYKNLIDTARDTQDLLSISSQFDSDPFA